MLKRQYLIIASLASFLSACNGKEFNFDTMSFEEPCPANLSHLRAQLVTPPEVMEEYIGLDVLERTLNEPIDDMIARDGTEATLKSGQNNAAEYAAILQNPEELRAIYLAGGKTEEEFQQYLLTVQDGVTINRGLVEAVQCRMNNAQ